MSNTLEPYTCLILRIRDTKAFRDADKAWPLESWTSEEWKRVEKAAEKELKCQSGTTTMQTP